MISSSMLAHASYSDEVILEYDGVNYGKIIYSGVVDEGDDTFNIELDYGVETRNWTYKNVAPDSICTIEPSDFGGYVIAGLWAYTLSENGMYITREDSEPIQLLSNGQAVVGYGFGYKEYPVKYNSPTSFAFGDNISQNPVHGDTHSYFLYPDGTLYLLQCDFYNDAGERLVTCWQPCFVKNEDSTSQNNAEITVLIHGEKISFDQPPIIINGRTLVPVRAIFETLGATVEWEAETGTVIAKRSNTRVSLSIGNSIMTKNSKDIVLDVAPQLINGRTLVPARAVAEAFECNVDWDGSTSTVIITNK